MLMSNEEFILRLKALADPVRLRIVALCGVAECSVSELTQVLGLSQPRVFAGTLPRRAFRLPPRTDRRS
jgi:ArsR family transcriptional regulator